MVIQSFKNYQTIKHSFLLINLVLSFRALFSSRLFLKNTFTTALADILLAASLCSSHAKFKLLLKLFKTSNASMLDFNIGVVEYRVTVSDVIMGGTNKHDY